MAFACASDRRVIIFFSLSRVCSLLLEWARNIVNKQQKWMKSMQPVYEAKAHLRFARHIDENSKLFHSLFNESQSICFGYKFHSQCHNKVVIKQIVSSSSGWASSFWALNFNYRLCSRIFVRNWVLFRYVCLYTIRVEIFWVHQL